MKHPDDCKKLMELRWSRQDLGVGPEIFVVIKDEDGSGLKAVLLERGLEGECAGWLRRGTNDLNFANGTSRYGDER